MSHSKNLKLISDILYDVCEVDPTLRVEGKSRFIEDLALDSMAMLALSAELENRLKQVLEYSFENPPHTVGELAELIDRQNTRKSYENTL